MLTNVDAHTLLRRLAPLGGRNVAHFLHGKQEWAEAGLPIEQDGEGT
jgi:hypothetical protein